MAEKSPFLAGPMITDPRFFVGRQQELEIILSRMIGDQPISISLVGAKRIGKSSLLRHLSQTYEEKLSGKGVDPKNYAMVYLSVENYNSEPKLYEGIADKLLKALPNDGIGQRLKFQQNPVKSQLQARPLNRHDFSQAIRDCKKSGVLPVLCLDSFDNLGNKKNSFDLGFYANLRSLMDGNSLMLIMASRQPLDKLLPERYYTSFFGNVGHSMTLKKLTEADAKAVSRLPESTSDGAGPALSPHQQKLTLQWGKQHPYLLQLAADSLWTAQQQGLPEKLAKRWAKQEFDRHAYKLSSTGFQWMGLCVSLRWIVWNFPQRLGAWAWFLGSQRKALQQWVAGIIIISVVVLAVLLRVPWDELQEWLSKFFK